ncbi:MAG: FAD-dependent monooxygenase [Rickettsiales bacterium]|nr:FAD-dependent monooxygenase [Rickettsiales bacterium]
MFDIVIIGGSFAGMTASLSLLEKVGNLKIAIIEKNDLQNEEKKADGRAYAISSKSLDLFRRIGIYDELQKVAGKIEDIKITDYKSPFFLDFIGKEVDEKEGQLGQIIENYHIFNALRKKVLENENITLFAPNSYADIEFGNESTKVILDNGKVLESKLILGCDGRFSELRQKYDIYTATKNYYQKAIVFAIKHAKKHDNVAWEKFLPGGPLAILPFHNQNESSIVWISRDELSEAIFALDEENFKQQLMKKMDNCLGEVEVISKKFIYPLTLVEAEKFYHERLLLIGDASCAIHPIAGQGFNLAIRNIEILANLIAKSDGVLDKNLIVSFNKKAKIAAKKMVIATDVLNSIFETKCGVIGIARDIGLGAINKLPKLKKIFIKSAGGF